MEETVKIEKPIDILKAKIRKATKNKKAFLNGSIIDDPIKKCYRFKLKEKELFNLKINDMKLLPDNLRKPFYANDKDFYKILPELITWANS
jgi:hypothetical protein